MTTLSPTFDHPAVELPLAAVDSTELSIALLTPEGFQDDPSLLRSIQVTAIDHGGYFSHARRSDDMPRDDVPPCAYTLVMSEPGWYQLTYTSPRQGHSWSRAIDLRGGHRFLAIESPRD
jgi:hypothetical protein